jgi:cold shock CspA family protein
VFPDSEQGGEGPLEAEVKWYNARKGFGFVLGPDGQDVFFHASALTEAGVEPPDTGDKFMCEIGTDRQGRRLVTRIHSMTKGPGGGDRPRPGHLIGLRGEGPVGDDDLVRMDQGLAVEAEFHALPALTLQAFEVGDVVPDPVQDAQTVGPAGGDR